MKVLAAPEFSNKLSSLAASPRLLERIRALVASIESGPESKHELLGALSASRVDLLEEDIYAYRSRGARLFFTFGEDAGGEYALLLDIALYEQKPGQSESSYRGIDPSYNKTLNPHYNKTLNPHYNKTLNPHYNKTLNPHYNKTLNPHYNKTLNPHYNKTLNPHYNKTLNPHYNKTLNPHYNKTLNPHYNLTYGGPFVYDLNLHRSGYLVRAMSTSFLCFDEAGTFIGYCHPMPVGGYSCFDVDGTWSGYMVSATDGVFLRYGMEGDWSGIVINGAGTGPNG